MLNIEVASNSFWQFARLWKNGETANFQMSCEHGGLEMSFSAKIGHPDILHFPPPPPPPPPPPSSFTRKTPSQLRRKERRKKEKAEKAQAEEIENESEGEEEIPDTEVKTHGSPKKN